MAAMSVIMVRGKPSLTNSINDTFFPALAQNPSAITLADAPTGDPFPTQASALESSRTTAVFKSDRVNFSQRDSTLKLDSTRIGFASTKS